MKIKCIIVDDEPLARDGLKEFVERTSFLELLGSFASASQTLEFLKSNDTVDLVFLDIQMPEMTGIELLKKLNAPPKIILTTAYREFALEGFELNAVDYLLKPFSYDRFLKALDKVLSMNNDNSKLKEYIFIKCDGMIVKIRLDDIVYVETAKDYVFIHTDKTRYMTLVSLRHFEENLPSSKFMRVHRYFLVALKCVQKLEGNQLYVNEHKIRISRNLRDEVYRRIIGDRLIERS